MIVFIVTLITSVLGVYGFFTYNIVLVAIGGICAIIELLIGLFNGQLQSIGLDVIAAVVGALVFYNMYGAPYWIGAFTGLCIANIIMGILGLLLMIVTGVSMLKKPKE
jgi:hypothetical protein